MCGGGGGGGNDSLRYQREQDRKRRQRIAEGKQQLDQIFGELEGQQRVADQDYLNMSEDEFRDEIASILDGGVVTQRTQDPRTGLFNGFNGTGGAPAFSIGRSFTPEAQRRLDEMGLGDVNRPIRQTSTSSGDRFGRRQMTSGGGISTNISDYLKKYRQAKADPSNYSMQDDPNAQPIWKQQEEAFRDFANPQLMDQYGDAQKEQTFALARQGVDRSSIASENRADLNRDFQLQQQNVDEQARGYGNQARSDISSQKQSLLNMLNASADPGATATAARSAIDSIRSQPSFSPLGPLFQNTTAGLAAGVGAQQAAQQRKQYNDITYGGDPDKSSGSVRR